MLKSAQAFQEATEWRKHRPAGLATTKLVTTVDCTLPLRELRAKR